MNRASGEQLVSHLIHAAASLISRSTRLRALSADLFFALLINYIHSLVSASYFSLNTIPIVYVACFNVRILCYSYLFFRVHLIKYSMCFINVKAMRRIWIALYLSEISCFSNTFAIFALLLSSIKNRWNWNFFFFFSEQSKIKKRRENKEAYGLLPRAYIWTSGNVPLLSQISWPYIPAGLYSTTYYPLRPISPSLRLSSSLPSLLLVFFLSRAHPHRDVVGPTIGSTANLNKATSARSSHSRPAFLMRR